MPEHAMPEHTPEHTMPEHAPEHTMSEHAPEHATEHAPEHTMPEHPPALQALPIDAVVGGRYRIRQVLGQKRMSRTYGVANIHNQDAPAILKEFMLGGSDGGVEVFNQVQEPLRQAMSALGELYHPQIPRFQGYFQKDGRFFIARDYIPGKNYREVLQDHGPFSELECLDFLRNLLGVFDYLHRQKRVVHHNLSPENIIQAEGSGRVYLVDFGLGRQVEQILAAGVDPASSAQVLSPGQLGYCPPEQRVTGDDSESSDLYALAMITIELLTGQRSRDPSTWQQHLPCPISHILAAVLTKMLAYQVADRYPSAHSVLEALAAIPANLADIPTTIEPGLSATEAESTGPHFPPDPASDAFPHAAANPASAQSSSNAPAADLRRTAPASAGSAFPWPLFFPIFLALGLLGFWALQQLQSTDPTRDPFGEPTPASSVSPAPKTPEP
ncbi:MAG: serine/threonine protein kinase [Prochlorothrix sp.]